MKRVITPGSLLGFVSVSLFMTTEIIAAAAAAVWSLSGLLHLDSFPTLVLGTLIGVASLYGIVKSTIMAFDAETDSENN